jgi:hypothetical protein
MKLSKRFCGGSRGAVFSKKAPLAAESGDRRVSTSLAAESGEARKWGQASFHFLIFEMFYV